MQSSKKLIEYDFYEYIEYQNIQELIKISLKLDDNIIFLPNIFTYSNIYSKYDNHSNYAFIKINYEKLLMIPGYLIPFYIKNNRIYDIRLNIINACVIDDDEFIIRMKEHKLINILNFKFNFIGIDDKCDSDLLILSFFYIYIKQYISNIHNMNNTFTDLMNLIITNNEFIFRHIEIYYHFIDRIRQNLLAQILCNKNINNLKLVENNIEICTDIDAFIYDKAHESKFNKYLKYKQKYFLLKNKNI